MIKINCIEAFVKKDHSQFSTFVIEPFETGQSITLGNALRRILLSDLASYGVKGVRVNDIKNEYMAIPTIREDFVELLLNFKQILFKESILLHEKTKMLNDFSLPGYISEKGPKIVTASMIKLPKNTLAILNPEQYICTIVKPSDFFCELDIALGKGYEANEFGEKNEIILPGKPKTLSLDNSYNPVQKVNFKVKLIYDSYGNLKEALYFDIITNGTKTPKRCLYESLKCLLDIIYPLLSSEIFLELKSDVAKHFLFEKKSESIDLV